MDELALVSVHDGETERSAFLFGFFGQLYQLD